MSVATVPTTGPLVFAIDGMDCGDCARSLERVVGELPDVATASVNFGAATLTVLPVSDARDGLPRAIGGAVDRAGYTATLRTEDGIGRNRTSRRPWWRERLLLPAALAGLGWLIATLLNLSGAPLLLVNGLFAGSTLVGGLGFARAGWQAMRARRLDMNVLMTVSVVGAAVLGEWAEAAMVVTLFALGGTLQALTIDRTRGAIRALMDLSPDEATLVRDGVELTVAAASLVAGALVRVRPGGRVPADGRIVAGHSAIDQSAITGESLPVEKEPGETVFAGTVNGSGSLLLEITSPAAESTLARIIHLVEEAQGRRAPSQQLVDRFAAVYTPAIMVAAALLAIGGALVTGDPEPWVYRALVLLVIACPCALVISTPVAIVAAIGAATRRGVLVKGGAALEAAGQIRAVALDKTGTLTQGRPAVMEVLSLDGANAETVLSRAAAVERLSEHPLGRAVVARALHDGVPIPDASDFQALPGLGAHARIGEQEVTVGGIRLFEESGLLPTTGDGDIQAALARIATAGQTPLLVAEREANAAPRLIGLIAVADKVRPNAARALGRLRRVGIERIVVLTGDAPTVGEAVRRTVGADEVRAGLRPAEKAAALQEIRDRYGAVAMIGDGVNDAPALATADVGIAMGVTGTDVALETADLALMGDDLSAVADALTLSRRTTRIIRQNITLSLAVKALALLLGAAGFVNLWVAVAADMGTSLAVTLNGLRLARSGNLSQFRLRWPSPVARWRWER